ncbi:ABC transporter ATP-binding protein [Serinibacter salmoneus]|uniref:ABC-type multidrug transport system fused ATPase/permease subunit n=1 Tax=Serinibacter salmoneus TaxID=556530 RepID=A0A2A9CZ92_9MICO|nr:ABC transporter ATP-binding protein [Serinibacter salmoneus]PFG19002.1 ABC-type multidrug transport system fused ATPase/permease subunit [Serinibacter salmoneus]
MIDLHRSASAPPPTAGVWRLLAWRAAQQRRLVVLGVLVGVVNVGTQAAAPWVLGQAVDDGLELGVSGPLLTWCAILLGLWAVRAVSGVVAHRLDVANWVRAALGTIEVTGDAVARNGEAVRREMSTGEIVATVASDAPRIAEVFAFVGRFLGSIIAYLAVAAILLSASTTLGTAVLLGIPLVAGVLALVVRPLQARQAEHREQNGRLTTLGSDTVSGLRILRGIGGEAAFVRRYRDQSRRVQAAGVQVARTQSLLDALQALLPGLFLVGVIWYGARLAITGEIEPGQLVAFYGYAAFLTEPLAAATQGVQILTRARIAAKRVLRVIGLPGEMTTAAAPRPLPSQPADLHDPASGLRVSPGADIALVSADPDETAAIATRLGRLRPESTSARYGGVPLAEAALDEVRSRIVVSEATPTLFSGILAAELDVRDHATQAQVLGAMHTADADDVLDSLPGGLAGYLPEKGRSLSGGQRQRVALARALLTEAEVLVLVEPTSAVDAHTEARIARRLRTARAGRTTVIVSASPLVLDQVEQVVLVQEGRVVASGRHHQFMQDAERAARGELAGEAAHTAIAYRRIVSRSVDDSPAETPGTRPAHASDATDTADTAFPHEPQEVR